MRLRDALARCRREGTALLATNFYNVETLRAVLAAAKRCDAALILQTSPSTIAYLGLDVAIALARSAAHQEGVRAWLHLDHATDPELVTRCIRAGYDSVMLDASERPLDENIRLTRTAVELAHRVGILVEAELGYVPKLEQADTRAGFTDPDDARRFVAATGVDLLAVAIGNAHGFYTRAPDLDLPRLAAIDAACGIPLVLHGGSGLSAEDWRACMARGVAKINLATEIKDRFMTVLRDTLGAADDIDLRRIFPPATRAATDLVSEKIAICTGSVLPGVSV